MPSANEADACPSKAAMAQPVTTRAPQSSAVANLMASVTASTNSMTFWASSPLVPGTTGCGGSPFATFSNPRRGAEPPDGAAESVSEDAHAAGALQPRGPRCRASRRGRSNALVQRVLVAPG